MIPERGDIVWLDFNPQSGKEITKKRPALVISEKVFNKGGLAVVCPITSTPARHSFHIPLPSNLQTTGCVKTEQLKSLDYRARNLSFIEKAPQSLVMNVRAIIARIV